MRSHGCALRLGEQGFGHHRPLVPEEAVRALTVKLNCASVHSCAAIRCAVGVVRGSCVPQSLSASPPTSRLTDVHGAVGDLWVPPTDFPLLDEPVALSGGGGAAVSASSGGHKPRTPPPDLPSLLLNARIVYLGMPLVPAVTELIVAELLYLQYADGAKPIYVYINSTGTTRADGETIGFETEGTAILDTMRYVKNDVRFRFSFPLMSFRHILLTHPSTYGPCSIPETAVNHASSSIWHHNVCPESVCGYLRPCRNKHTMYGADIHGWGGGGVWPVSDAAVSRLKREALHVASCHSVASAAACATHRSAASYRGSDSMA